MRILVTGATGLLGRYLVREVHARGHELVAWSAHGGQGSRAVDLEAESGLVPALELAAPDVVVHAGALSAVADCARDPSRARRVNTRATEVLASACRARGARFVLVSTDLVFDGASAPYAEEDAPRPLSVYGRTKAEAEELVLRASGLVVRASLLHGPGLDGRRGTFDGQVEALRSGRGFDGFVDEHRTPVALDTAARALLALGSLDVSGIVHLGGSERVSRFAMGRRLALHLGVSPSLVRAASRTSVPGEPRPADTSLRTERLRALEPTHPVESLELAWERMASGA